MKKLVLFISAVLFVVTCNAGSLSDSLVAYYPFTGNANDSSGNNNHGTVMNALLTTDAIGNSNAAYYFDGDEDYIILNSPVMGQNDVTISMWVRFDDLSKNMSLFTTRDQCASNYRGWAPHNIAYEPQRGFIYRVIETTSCSGGSSGDYYSPVDFTPEVGVFYFISIVVQNNDQENRTVLFYINGKEYQTSQIVNAGSNEAYNGSDYRTLLGGYSNVNTNYINSFSGILDEIRVYDRMLDSLEIDTLFNEFKDQDSIFIINHPKGKEVYLGENHTLKILALGDSMLYRWYKDAQLLVDTNSNHYVIQNMSYSDTGNYYCMVYNNYDTVYSDTASIAWLLEKNLLAYYPFNGNANDVSGYDFHGMVSGAQLTFDRLGNDNAAYYFDGTDYINCGNDSLLSQNFNEFTFSAWFYPEFGNENSRILNTRGQGSYGNNWPGYLWKIGSNENKNQWNFHGTGIEDADGDYSYCNQCGSFYDYGEWYHAAYVFNGDSIILYVNGNLNARVNVNSIEDFSTTFPITIGATIVQDGILTGTPTRSFKGMIDEVKIYDKALSEANIKEDYEKNRYQDLNEDLLLWYPFNHGAYDASGNGFHGTVNNAKLVDDPHTPGNKAYYFDGDLDFINAGDSSELELVDSFTLQAWVNPNGYTNDDKGVIMSKEGEYDIRVSSTGELNYVLYTSSGDWVNTSTGVQLDNHQWSFITLTFANKMLKAYKNDQLLYSSQRSNLISGDKFPQENNLYVGSRQHDNELFNFKGMIDEVKIYKRVLDSVEIANAFAQGRNTKGDVIDIVDTTVVLDTLTYTDTVAIMDTNYVTVTDTLLIDVTFENVSGVEEVTTIKVYPNPANEYVMIQIDQNAQIQDYTVKITNASGSAVYESLLNQNPLQINIEDFGALGLYFIEILDDAMNTITTRKIMLE